MTKFYAGDRFGLWIDLRTMPDQKLLGGNKHRRSENGLVAVIGWADRKVAKENFTDDPRKYAMNYVKFSAALAGSISLKEYLIDKKIIPDNI